MLTNLQSNTVLRCRADIKQDEIFNEVQQEKRKQFKERPIAEKKQIAVSSKTSKLNVTSQLEVPERHSTLKQDPKSCLGYLRPKNEEQEKDKFKYYWDNFSAKGKIYNPRFQYRDQ